MEFPIHIGPIHPHPVFELLAYSIGFQVFLAMRRRHPDGFTTDRRMMLFFVTVAGAFVGAKVLAWLVDPMTLWQARGDWQAWLAGKTIVGGLLGGLIAVETAKRAMGITASTGDLYAIPLALGIAIGRIGCFMTGLADRTYGDPTGLPWGVDFGDGLARHPTQIYEILFLAVLMLVLVRHMQSGYANGDQFKLFMLAYLAWRLVVGFIQPGHTLLGLTAIQWASLATLVVYGKHIPRILASVRDAWQPRPRPTPELAP